MLTKRIIPCLDVKDGRVVKGISFQNLTDAGSMLEQARFYNAELADELVFLDISATLEGRRTMQANVELVADEVFIPLTVGGGISSVESARDILKCGADKVSINTAAVLRPKLISELAERFGSQAVVVALDVKRVGGEYKVFTHAGKTETALNAFDWAKTCEANGAGELLVTSIDADGTRNGYDLTLLRLLSEVTSLPVIASGGAGNLVHLYEAFTEGKADAALAASIFHFRETSIIEAKQYLMHKGLAMRL
jgi:cyclase